MRTAAVALIAVSLVTGAAVTLVTWVPRQGPRGAADPAPIGAPLTRPAPASDDKTLDAPAHDTALAAAPGGQRNASYETPAARAARKAMPQVSFVVRGPPGMDAERTTATACAVGRYGVEPAGEKVAATTGPDGALVFDLSSLIAQGSYREYVVTVDHPEFRPVTRKVEIPLDENARWVRRYEQVERITLEPALFLEGRVRFEGARNVDDALRSTSVWAFRPSGASVGDQEWDSPEEPERFRIRVADGREGAVDVVAASRHFAPERYRSIGPSSGRRTIPDFVLRTDARIYARAGAPTEEQSRSLQATCAGAIRKREVSSILGSELWFVGDEPLWGRATAFEDRQGGFWFSGLARLPYRLTVVARDAGYPLDPDVEASSSVLVRPPDDRVTVSFARSVLRFQVRDDERVLRFAEIAMEARTGRVELDTGVESIAGVVVPPGERRTVVVSADGHDSRTIEVLTPPDGESRLDVVSLGKSTAPAPAPATSPTADDGPDEDDSEGPRIDVKGTDDEPLDVPCRISRDGQRVDVRFVAQDGCARLLRSGRLFRRETRVTPALGPGRYVFEVGGDGYERATFSFDVPESRRARADSTPSVVLLAR